MNKCKQCGSYAINPHMASGSRNPDLCDLCYWKNETSSLQSQLAEARKSKVCRWTRRCDEDGLLHTKTGCGHGGYGLGRWVVTEGDHCRKCGGLVEVV